MKRLIAMMITVLAIVGLLFMVNNRLESANGMSQKHTLRIFNWGDFIDPDLITKFENETGIHVSYETFDSNEAMYAKLIQGSTHYDITVPSDYLLEKLIKENILMPLDHTKINGLENIRSNFLNLSFDPNNKYSIPYMWGTLGIVYNDKYIQEGEIKKWSDLWQPKYRNQILMIDGAREVIGIGLQKQYYSLNETDNRILQDTARKLDDLMPNIKALLADEIKMYMVQEEAPIAVTFSGEAADMMAQNEHLHYVIPEEGSNLWFDNLVIPKNAENVEEAYTFINFMLRPENAAQNAVYIGYATPNEKALKLMDTAITSDKNFYPDETTLKRLEVYQSLPFEVLELYNDLFLEVKMTRG